jgi:hypothetical protein
MFPARNNIRTYDPFGVEQRTQKRFSINIESLRDFELTDLVKYIEK